MPEPSNADEDPWGLPSPDHVKGCIESWRSLDLLDATDAEIEESLLELRDRIGSWLVQRRTTRFLDLYRVRRDGDRFDTVDDFWTLRPCRVEKPGRCNMEEQPVLYSAPKAVTALEEMNARPGDRIVLIHYQGRHQVGVDRIVGFEDPNPRDGKRIIEGDNLTSYQLLRTFLQEEFTKPVPEGEEHLYRTSAAICRTWTDGADNDGWLYPSVKSMSRENVALLPASARKSLIVKQAFLAEVIDDRVATTRLGTFSGFALRSLDSADVSEDAVSWSGSGGLLNFYR